MRPPHVPPAPAHAEGLRLHQALGSPAATATWDFARAYFPHLTAWLRAMDPRAPADLCEEAVVETIYSLLSNPDQFNPTKGKTLLNFLRLSARCDLLNLLRREARHRHENLDENSVAFASSAGKFIGKDKGPLQTLCDGEDEQERQRLLEKLYASLTATERVVLDLMLSGVSANEVFVRAMEIPHLPLEEQKRQVKRVKDRLHKRIQRMKDRP